MVSITDSMDVNWETVEDRGAWHAAVHGVAVRHDSDYTTTMVILLLVF